MPLRMLFVHCLTLVAGVAATPGLARAAENADKCADAYELTQSEQRAGRLFEAREEARICAAACPPRLASDCAAWETHITAEIPSFVVHVRGPDGAPIPVEVQVDGSAVTLTQTGSIEAVPGPHRLLLRHAGKSVEAHVELVSGVRNQLVEVTIADSATPAPAPVAVAPVPPPSRASNQRPSASVWRWVLGGVGLATLATGGAISVSGEILADQLRGSCKPHCTQGQADEVVQRWVIGGTVMGVGGALFLGALLWPRAPSSQPPPGGGLAMTISARPGQVAFEVAF